MPSVKKSKKDAKETGGVVAAVTKQAAGKFKSNGNAPGFASDTSNSSSVQSPEIQPVATPSSHGNPSISPMLDAVPTAAAPHFRSSPSAIPGMADWPARAGPHNGVAGSPGNLICFAGESPPSRWSSPRPTGTSYTSHTSHTSHASHASHASRTSPGSHPTSVSVSPPSAADYGMASRRPLSYHMDAAGNGHYPSMAQASPKEYGGFPATSASIRRSSLHSHYANSRASPGAAISALAAASPNPPLPHQPQAHFYAPPDIDLDLNPRQVGIKPGQRGYHFSFDALPSPLFGSGSAGTDTVVTAGYEGGLEVHAASKRGLDPLFSLAGLRGGVYQAKILPWMASPDVGVVAELFPLVVVVIHGPVLPEPADNGPAGPGGVGFGVSEAGDATTSRSQAPPSVDGRSEYGAGRNVANAFPIECYQTTVEVYSLKTSRRVCVLLEAPQIPLAVSVTSPIFEPPPPTGAFHIKADSGSIAIASAATGECWIYRQMAIPGEDGLPFRFVAKVWTTLQQSLKGSSGGDLTPENDRTRAASITPGQPLPRYSPKQPVLSLSGRWLAYCPATPSSQILLNAHVPVPAYGRVPGYSSRTPPQLPPNTADVDLPQTESVMNKIMRDATQEIISGAKWVGQQGWQAFNSYWKGGAGASTPQPARSPPTNGGYLARADITQFPPTHGGASSATVSKEPGLVSVVDILALGSANAVHPVATFSPPLGCSFLSFSPTGLWLFTASTKGDVQTVWDLLRIQYTKASPLQTSAIMGGPAGPRVRQIAQFSRMTVARIVDVAWTKPDGERLAMVTERGTVHLLDLPSSAFTWPPPRRRATRVPDTNTGAVGGPGATESGSAGTASTAVSYASSAFKTTFDAARPLLTRPRRSSANVPPSTTSTSIKDHASHGGKIIAAGISHSLGKTGSAINHLRHTGENRVTLPLGMSTPGPSYVVWVTGKRSHTLFALGSGLVRVFANRSRRTTSGQRTVHLVPKRDCRLPDLPDDLLAPAVKQFLEPEEYLDFTDHADAGANTMVLMDNSRGRNSAPRLSTASGSAAIDSSIPQAEIESSAPYQPFHTDRRVALYEFDTVPLQNEVAPAPVLATNVAPPPPPAPAPVAAPVLASPAIQAPLAALIAEQERPASPGTKSKKKAKAAAALEARRQREAAEAAEAAEQDMDFAAWIEPEKTTSATPVMAALNAASAAASTAVLPPVPPPAKAKDKSVVTPTPAKAKAKTATLSTTSWAFGQPIGCTLVNTGYPPMSEEESFNINFDDTRALPPSAMERVLQHVGDGDDQIVVTTRRRRGGGRMVGDEDEDGFFEDDCEVLDFADQRV